MIDWIKLPGLVKYQDGLAQMEEKLLHVIDGTAEETVFLLEHDHVYTAGTNFNQSELLNTHDVPVIYTGRGGKFTYHGPGQRVIYPILNLANKPRAKDLKQYVRDLENWIIASISKLGLKCFTIPGLVGIWIMMDEKPAKVAAIGVRVKKWVTYHGIAVNIKNDLSMYRGIIPCGIKEYSVTSLHDAGVNVDLEQFDQILIEEFKNFF